MSAPPPLPTTTHHGKGAAGLALLVALALACTVAPLLNDGAGPLRADRDPVLTALTDGRGSLSFALLSGLLGAGLGVAWSGLAIALGDRAERRLMGAAARLVALPLALLVPLGVGLTGGGLPVLTALVAFSAAPLVAGLAHEELRALLRRDFLTAARAAGRSKGALLLHHLLPNAVRPLLAAGAIALPRALAVESLASLLGLGLPSSVGSWGGAVGVAARLGDGLALVPAALLLALSLWAFHAVADEALRLAAEGPHGGPSNGLPGGSAPDARP